MKPGVVFITGHINHQYTSEHVKPNSSKLLPIAYYNSYLF